MHRKWIPEVLGRKQRDLVWFRRAIYNKTQFHTSVVQYSSPQNDPGIPEAGKKGMFSHKKTPDQIRGSFLQEVVSGTITSLKNQQPF